ncbi:hypothetical protein L218DRAFT_949338 [Marasmius fiardii PR-910]|nr:hypothetical protein L218DRAFT_949338 [Marasmius fiardii PR-910]
MPGTENAKVLIGPFTVKSIRSHYLDMPVIILNWSLEVVSVPNVIFYFNAQRRSLRCRIDLVKPLPYLTNRVTAHNTFAAGLGVTGLRVTGPKYRTEAVEKARKTREANARRLLVRKDDVSNPDTLAEVSDMDDDVELIHLG